MDLSPDSSLIVFVANDQLHLRPVNQMESTTIPGTQGGEKPFFSPDGQWVGFWAGGELKKVLLGGGPPQRLCSTLNPLLGVTWGPDDTFFFSDGQNILRVPSSGGEPKVVVAHEPGAGDAFPESPEILPGGDTLLFHIEGGLDFDDMQVVAQSLDTDERHVLLEGGSQPRYLPTGHLIYLREDTLLAVAFDPASLEVKGHAVPLVRGVGRMGGQRRAH